MDKLWAPWRISYVSAKKERGCLFCRAFKAPDRHHVVFKSRYSLIMLNLYPYNNGHLMVAPARHVKSLDALSEKELLDLMGCLNRAKKMLDKVLKPHGYNIGINLGEMAGAGIAGHLHIHIVPRWKGDTNFMPVLGSTKIISQSLEELLRLLKNA